MNALEPYRMGELDFDKESCEPTGFKESPAGRMALWGHPDAMNIWPGDREYVVGADIAQGTGTSNSVVSAYDCRTGEQILELVSPHIKPPHLARYSVAIAKWLGGASGGALLIWEGNGGGGSQFRDEVINTGYHNLWYRRDERTPDKRVSDVPGWYSTADNKEGMLARWAEALDAGECVTRSARAYKEATEYVHSGRSVVHPHSETCTDPSGAKENHGDRVIANAICWQAISVVPPTKDEPDEIPVGTFGWRLQQALAESAKEDGWLH
jgi:hypothetical protein